MCIVCSTNAWSWTSQYQLKRMQKENTLNDSSAVLGSLATSRLTTEREKQCACTRSKKPGGWTEKLEASCALLLSDVRNQAISLFFLFLLPNSTGKEMSACKLSHPAWPEEKAPLTFYQGHVLTLVILSSSSAKGPWSENKLHWLGVAFVKRLLTSIECF